VDKMERIDDTEKIYLLLIFILLLAFVIIFGKYGDKILNMNFILQFLIMNVTIYLLLCVVFKALALEEKVHVSSWKAGIAGILLWIGLDTLLPEYHVSFSGEIITGGLFGNGATDYLFGKLGQSIGVHGEITMYPIFLYALLIVLISFLVYLLVKRKTNDSDFGFKISAITGFILFFIAMLNLLNIIHFINLEKIIVGWLWLWTYTICTMIIFFSGLFVGYNMIEEI
jgi:hypothetical protein